MKNSEYWQQRFVQLEAAQHKIGAASFIEIEKQYRQAQKQMEGQIALWYQRLADNNGISLAEARKMLVGNELKEFQWDVREYIKYGKENAISQSWMKELENTSAKYHITKLEALKVQMQHNLEVMYTKQLQTVTDTMTDVLQSGYYHTAYEIQKGFGIGWDIAGLNQTQIEKVLSKPWAVDGYNFSERIWKNKNKLISEVYNELSQNIMLGADPQKAIDAIAKKMNTSRYNAGRLVMTEEAYFSSIAQKECFQDLDVEQYEIVATLDSHTSEICKSLDGKVFPMKDYQAGVTAPPFHVWCRTTTVPYFADNFGEVGERAAKSADGKTYYVPANMIYKDWEKAFVQGGSKDHLTIRTTDDIMKLTAMEQWALNEYISSGSYKINELLRAGAILTESEKEWIDNLDAALKKMPIYKGLVYRSMDSSMIFDIDSFWEQHTIGKKITYFAYTSSATKIYDDNMDIQIIIKSKTGKDIRQYNSEEFEILFPRNSTFMVIDRKENTIWMEQIE